MQRICLEGHGYLVSTGAWHRGRGVTLGQKAMKSSWVAGENQMEKQEEDDVELQSKLRTDIGDYIGKLYRAC